MTERAKSDPKEIVAVDWGATPAKRQRCRAVLRAGRYVVLPPEPVVQTTDLPLESNTLVGLDAVLGLPPTYADRAGLVSFRDGLSRFGTEAFAKFYEPAAIPEEVSVERPFYPAKPGGASREVLQKALGEAAFGLRACDRVTGAGPLFWLVGPKQVGKASLSLWRDVLAPRRDILALWPFDGPLPALLDSGRCVVAEIYPAFLARAMGLEVNGKRSVENRVRAGRQLLAQRWNRLDLFEVRSLLETGFGDSPAGEDPFDATVACIGLVHLYLEGRLGEPPEAARSSEGWILGL